MTTQHIACCGMTIFIITMLIYANVKVVSPQLNLLLITSWFFFVRIFKYSVSVLKKYRQDSPSYSMDSTLSIIDLTISQQEFRSKLFAAMTYMPNSILAMILISNSILVFLTLMYTIEVCEMRLKTKKNHMASLGKSTPVSDPLRYWIYFRNVHNSDMRTDLLWNNSCPGIPQFGMKINPVPRTSNMWRRKQLMLLYSKRTWIES